MAERRDLGVEVKGLKQRGRGRDSDGSVDDQEVEAAPCPLEARVDSSFPAGSV